MSSFEPVDNASLEETVTNTVQSIMSLLFGLGSSIATIERNTRDAFWWTSWTIIALMGLFIVNLLVRLRTQLVKLNTYQSTFEKMWTEDRANDERVRREAAQERQIENLRTPQLMQARARIENQINEILEGVGPAPPRGTPEYEQFMREIGDYLRNVEGN